MGKLIDAVLIKGLPAQDIKNATKVNLWIFLWAGSLVATVLMQEILVIQSPIPSLIGVAINLICGLMMTLAYRRMLRSLDEMERKIQLDALALSVAITMLAYGASSILHNAGLISEFEASWMLSIMAFAYAGGLIVGRLRLA